jgi:Tol biopolymer transport system component
LCGGGVGAERVGARDLSRNEHWPDRFWHERGGNVDVYTALPNGNDLRRLTDDPSFDACVAYSPDGKEIAFCSNRNGNFEIWAMKQNGTDEHQMTHTGGRMIFKLTSDFGTAWSPDGSRIAFVRDFGGGDRPVMLMNANGSDQHLLTGHGALQFVAGWQPRGERIDH